MSGAESAVLIALGLEGGELAAPVRRVTRPVDARLTLGELSALAKGAVIQSPGGLSGERALEASKRPRASALRRRSHRPQSR